MSASDFTESCTSDGEPDSGLGIDEWDPEGGGAQPAFLRPGKFDSVFVYGPRMAGKTCLASILLTDVAGAGEKEGFNLIFVYSNSPQTLELYKRLVPSIRKRPGDEPINFIEWSSRGPQHIEQLKLVQNSRVRAGKPMLRLLLILDDVVGELKKGEENVSLTQVFTAGRHMGASIWLISQTYTHVPTSVRRNSDIVFLGHSRSGVERDLLQEDVVRGAILHDDLAKVVPLGEPARNEKELARRLYQESTLEQGFLVVDHRSKGRGARETLFTFRARDEEVAAYEKLVGGDETENSLTARDETDIDGPLTAIEVDDSTALVSEV